MRLKGLFSKQPAPYKPAPQHVNTSNPHHNTHEHNLLKWVKKHENALEHIKQVKSSSTTLSSSYEQRKAVQAANTSRLNFFAGLSNPSPERPDDINFITSIAESLGEKTKVTKNKLRELKGETHKLEAASDKMSTIVTGAYLYVMKKIEDSYKNAWVSKDPKSSQLYLELVARVGKKTDEEQHTCLTALHDHLQAEEIQKKIKFGSQKPDDVLAKLQEYIKVFVPSVSGP